MEKKKKKKKKKKKMDPRESKWRIKMRADLEKGQRKRKVESSVEIIASLAKRLDQNTGKKTK